MIFDYATLKVIWWAFVGLLIIAFALTGGYDMGVGMLLPAVGKNDEERRVTINAIGPTWEGNRSEERRVGKECVFLCRSRWSPYH